MEDELASEYDVIVLGTGMPESILAAAVARSGKTVLHLDRNEYYGNEWASFNLDGIRRWIRSNNDCTNPRLDENDYKNLLTDGETILKLSHDLNVISNVKEEILVNQGKAEETTEERLALEFEEKVKITEKSEMNDDESATKTSETEAEPEPSVSKPEVIERKSEIKDWKDLESNSRKFNLDLAPKVLFAQGSLVNLLISSNIARYAEFKCVTRILTYLNGKLEQVPCSRADIFSTRDVTIIEKRMLMKLLKFCLDYDHYPEEYKEFENKSFGEFLKAKKLTPNIQHYILHAIAMVENDSPTVDALQSVQRYLQSLGRYGNTPFLWPLFGSGELPQCFCRLCAVFGGVYCLKRSVDALILNESRELTGVVSQNRRINCKRIIIECSYFRNQIKEEDIKERKTSRAIFITDKSILKSDKEQITLLRLPASDAIKSAVYILELSPSSMACPQGLHVVHMTCAQIATAEEDLKCALEILFATGHCGDGDTGDRKAKILWSLYFNRCEIISDLVRKNILSGVTLTSGPGDDFDFDSAVAEAKSLFLEIYPDQEFLPRAPDPDEIIMDEPTENNSPESAVELETS